MAPDHRFGARRIYYDNFAAHLLNAYNPNMLYLDLPYRWSDADWRRRIDMIADFGFNAFEFWLVPRLFCREGIWQGEFIPEYQHTAWDFDLGRAERSMKHLLERLPDFPEPTVVAINLGFNSNSDPAGEQNAIPWANEIARTHRIRTWDFSLTEGENAILPHYRFDRLFAQRRREREAAPYSGGICFTMTPLLNQLSLYESAQSFLDPDGDPEKLAGDFYARLFGSGGRELVDLLPLFEVVPDWGNFAHIELTRGEFHRQMNRLADCLRALRGNEEVPFHPSVEEYRQELLFFAELFAALSGPTADYDALRRQYWERVYAIYDLLPEHVDPRPRAATDRLIGHFAARPDPEEPISG